MCPYCAMNNGHHPYPLCHTYRQMDDRVGGWVKLRAVKCDKVAKLKYKSFVTSLERADKKAGWVKSLSFPKSPGRFRTD